MKNMIHKKLKNNRVFLVAAGISSIKGPLKEALEDYGFEVHEFDYRKTTLVEKIVFAPSLLFHNFWHIGIKFVNYRLRKEFKKIEPSVVFVSKGETIYHDSINYFKENGAITINWFTDFFWQSPFFTEDLSVYDYVFTVDKMDINNFKNKVNLLFLPFSVQKPKVNPDFERKRYNITFIGRWTEEREKLMYELIKYKPRIWGNKKWKDTKVRKYYQGEWLSPKEVLDVYRNSKIVINHHQKFTDELKRTMVNLRVYEASAGGALVLTDFRKDLPLLFKTEGENREVVVYRDYSELKKLIEYYLLNNKERIMIAKNGFKRVLKDHTYHQRVKEIFQIISNNKSS
jgi:spore maturation protein CgeB